MGHFLFFIFLDLDLYLVPTISTTLASLNNGEHSKKVWNNNPIEALQKDMSCIKGTNQPITTPKNRTKRSFYMFISYTFIINHFDPYMAGFIFGNLISVESNNHLLKN